MEAQSLAQLKFGYRRLTPSSDGPNQSIHYQAEPEVNEGTHVYLKSMMPRNQRQMWKQRKIHDISQDDREQCFQEICGHAGFRHRHDL